MLSTLVMIGLIAAPAYIYRRLAGTAVSKMSAVLLLGGGWLLVLWLLGPSGAGGGPAWLHVGVLIAYGVLTHRERLGASDQEDLPRESTPAAVQFTPAGGESEPPGPVTEATYSAVSGHANHTEPDPGGRLWVFAGLAGVLLMSVWILSQGERGPRLSGANDPSTSLPLTSAAEPTGTIWEAAGSGRTESILHHFNGGVPVDVRDDDGNTPLIHAAAGGHRAAVALLLQLGADPNETGMFLTVALAEAAARGYRDIVAELLDHSADPNAQGILGASPLHFAVDAGDVAVAELLLRAGADPTLADVNGITPVDIAVVDRNEALLALIGTGEGR